MRVQEHDDVAGGGLGALSPRPDEAELGGVPEIISGVLSKYLLYIVVLMGCQLAS